MATAIAHELAEKLRDELAGSFGPLYTNKVRAVPLDELFYSVLATRDPTTGVKTILDKQCLSKYWNVQDPNLENSYIALPSSPQNYFLSLYTRNSWKYPWGGVIAKLPTLPITGTFWPFGFEPGPGLEWGLIGFYFYSSYFRAFCDGKYADITYALPSDYNTAFHRYMVKVNKNTAEFYIDYALVAVAIRGGIDFSPISGPPYAIQGTTQKGFDEAPAFIEFSYSSVSQYYIDPSQFRAMDGDPLPPRGYQLYLAGSSTKFAGYSISSGSVTSHPIPIFGYPRKTLYFMANQTGSLLIEVLTRTGNWRTYDSVSVSANTFKVYPMAGDAVLARVTFTPLTYPATISEAEFTLS
jgi:hypothetical protein